MEGESSRALEIRTDVQGPSAPKLINLTCSNLDSLYLQWERPSSFYNQIDYYYVYYRPEQDWAFSEISLQANKDQFEQDVSHRCNHSHVIHSHDDCLFLAADCEPDSGHTVRS